MLPTIATGNVASAIGSGYEVANSCKFDGTSAYMGLTLGTPTNNKIYTFSAWIKRSKLAQYSVMFNAGSSRDCLRFRGDNERLHFFTGEATTAGLATNRVFRDTTAWMHIVCAVDTTQSTAANRVKLYVNGTQETSFAVTNYPAEDYTNVINSAVENRIGKASNQYDEYFGGYMAEVFFIDGQQLTPTSFGEYDEDSPQIWKPKDCKDDLTFGNNGFYLDFEDSSNLGNDANGGSDFSETNLAASDSSTDSPTNNFATMNPLNIATSYAPTFSEGNLQSVSPVYGAGLAISTIGATSGKWYAEFYNAAYASLDRGSVGITGDANGTIIYAATNDHNIGKLSTSLDVGYLPDGQKHIGGSYSSYGNTYAVGDIISIALNIDDDEVIFYKNGTAQASGSAISFTSGGTYHFVTSSSSNGGGNTWVINFGQDGTFNGNKTAGGNTDGNGYGNFFYSVPANHYSLCTKNLAEYG